VLEAEVGLIELALDELDVVVELAGDGAAEALGIAIDLLVSLTMVVEGGDGAA